MLKVRGDGRLFIVAVVGMALASSLLLAATLSIPVLTTSRVLRLKANVDGLDRCMDFGIWGYCPVPVGRENNKNPTAVFPNCTKGFGWTFGPDVAQTLRTTEDLESLLTGVKTSMLVLYPISAAITIINFILSLVACASKKPTTRGPMQLAWRPRHLRNIFILDCVTAFFIVFTVIVHAELVGDLRKQMQGPQSGNPTLRVQWGNALWLCISALICLCVKLLIVRRIRIASMINESQIPQTHLSAQSTARKAVPGTGAKAPARGHSAHVPHYLPMGNSAESRPESSTPW